MIISTNRHWLRDIAVLLIALAAAFLWVMLSNAETPRLPVKVSWDQYVHTETPAVYLQIYDVSQKTAKILRDSIAVTETSATVSCDADGKLLMVGMRAVSAEGIKSPWSEFASATLPDLREPNTIANLIVEVLR